jgi:hypothetical protein
MKPGLAQEVFSLMENVWHRAPGPDFELAYKARLASDRVRFAIQATEHSCEANKELQEVRLQLLDALEVLATADRSFQRRFRMTMASNSESRRPPVVGGGRDIPASDAPSRHNNGWRGPSPETRNGETKEH